MKPHPSKLFSIRIPFHELAHFEEILRSFPTVSPAYVVRCMIFSASVDSVRADIFKHLLAPEHEI